jgi:hypothetical protein
MFKKTLVFITVLALADLALVLPAVPGTLPVSVVPDGTLWVVHMDMEKFVTTKVYEFLEKDGRLEVKNRDLTHWLKIDLFKDITGVTVFGLEPGEKQTVFAVAGKFDKARLLTLLDTDEKHQEIPYGGATIHVMEDGQGAFINDGLIVYSESRPAIEKVLDTAAGKAKNFASSKLHSAFKDISSGAFLSGVVKDWRDMAGLGTGVRQSKIADMAKDLLFFAQEKGDRFQVRVQVTADSPESGKNMADIVQGFIALGKMSRGEGHRAIPASLIDGLQIKIEGNVVSLELDMPSREFADMASRGKHLSFFD